MKEPSGTPAGIMGIIIGLSIGSGTIYTAVGIFRFGEWLACLIGTPLIILGIVSFILGSRWEAKGLGEGDIEGGNRMTCKEEILGKMKVWLPLGLLVGLVVSLVSILTPHLGL